MSVSHRVAVIALCALAALQVAWYGWWSPPTEISKSAAISFALVWFALPLLVARVDAGRALLVGALLALLYFSHGVMEAWASPSNRLPAVIEIVLTIIIVGCAGWPSWSKAASRKKSAALPGKG